MDPQPIIEVLDVKKSRGDREVLVGLSFSVKRGEFFSVLGPSGCGKTTLLRLLSGLEQPDAGSIKIEGRPLSEIRPRDQKILLVFQNFALFPHMSVAANVGFGLKLKGLPIKEIKERVHYYLDIVKLSALSERFPAQLSGGQQQRVAIARALAPEPAAVLFDEPLGALDQKLRREMQFELKNIQERLKSTFIYVTHDQEEALTLSDRVALMNHGEFEQLGTPFELYKNPSSSFAAQFIGDNNHMQAVVTEETADGFLKLSVADAQIVVKKSPGLTIGSHVDFYIRPELVQIAASKAKQIPADDYHVFDCETSQQLFVGRECILNLALDGQKIIAKVPADQSYKEQKKIRCYFRKSDVHLFPSSHCGGS